MPTTTEVRNAIVAKLQGITGIGLVHAFERYAKEPPKFQALFVKDEKIAGWLVRRASFREVRAGSRFNALVVRWQIRAYASLLDAEASELEFDLLIDRAAAAFRDDETLGGVIDGLSESGADGAAVGLQLDDSGPVMFAGALCHSARMSLTTAYEVEIGAPVADDLNSIFVFWDMANPNITGSPTGRDDQVDAEDRITFPNS